jgi:hypothetical protein
MIDRGIVVSSTYGTITTDSITTTNLTIIIIIPHLALLVKTLFVYSREKED